MTRTTELTPLLIETVLMSGFSYSKKRHPLGQRRVAVLGSKPVPVYLLNRYQ